MRSTPTSLSSCKRPEGAICRALAGEATTVVVLKRTIGEEEDAVGDLLLRLAAGHDGAFAQLYQATGAKLYGLAFSVVRDREAAKEVLQEAFILVWRKAGQYRPDKGTGYHWLAGIVRNKSIDHLRAQARRPAEGPSLDELPPLAKANVETLEGQSVESRAAVRGCLGRLQESQRTAICLAYYWGYSHEELAARMDAPLGTVKSWVRRGLMQLKACLDEQD